MPASNHRNASPLFVFFPLNALLPRLQFARPPGFLGRGKKGSPRAVKRPFLLLFLPRLRYATAMRCCYTACLLCLEKGDNDRVHTTPDPDRPWAHSIIAEWPTKGSKVSISQTFQENRSPPRVPRSGEKGRRGGNGFQEDPLLVVPFSGRNLLSFGGSSFSTSKKRRSIVFPPSTFPRFFFPAIMSPFRISDPIPSYSLDDCVCSHPFTERCL